jgi:hypothetical protein
MHAAFGAVAAVAGAATIWSGSVSDSKPDSRPHFVAAECRVTLNTEACAVALRYLAALDLDRTQEACALLDRSTLEAAGGKTGCRKRLAQAHGVRIHYSVFTVRRSPLGSTVRFSTWVSGRSPVRQQMLVSPAGRIVAVVIEP